MARDFSLSSRENTSMEASKQNRFQATLQRLSDRFPRIFIATWIVVLFLWLSVLPAIYYSWFVFTPSVWQWADYDVIRSGGAIVATIILVFAPFLVIGVASALSGWVADLTLANEAMTVGYASKVVQETEEDVLQHLESSDKAGLLPLLRYSRAQLDAYYAMGLAQTRRSFFSAALAMWLGFVILVLGIVLFIAPVEKIGLSKPPQDFQMLVLLGTLIVEVVSALFLWVYRSTTGQLTFYYRLQMSSHTAILCFRMANSMQEGDEAKRAIIDNLLQSAIIPERPATFGASRLKAPALPS